jgi:hypothetical protein
MKTPPNIAVAETEQQLIELMDSGTRPIEYFGPLPDWFYPGLLLDAADEALEMGKTREGFMKAAGRVYDIVGQKRMMGAAEEDEGMPEFDCVD